MKLSRPYSLSSSPKESQEGHYMLTIKRVEGGIASGSGITPFRSLAKAIADGNEDAELILLYGSRTLEDAIFQEEFKALENSCPKFKFVNVLSHEEKADCENGFITAELIRKYAPEGDYSLFLCGPQAMYDFVDKEIATLGLRRKFVRHELFGEYFTPSKEVGYPANVAPEFKLTVRIAVAVNVAGVIPDWSAGTFTLLSPWMDAVKQT